ncbi:hypothetical protein MLD38_025488 [Melastoma candidum]|uniref:Uncharacterized protein n=1 Tax=Melastoma candidum TaxID=119954 RepID=A0ACB9NV87_9MYRT|nr:hypothetical protein MLD38_025488 [Melastoma candidum]
MHALCIKDEVFELAKTNILKPYIIKAKMLSLITCQSPAVGCLCNPLILLLNTNKSHWNVSLVIISLIRLQPCNIAWS